MIIHIYERLNTLPKWYSKFLINEFLWVTVIYTVKHVYSDHAYNQMTLIMKRLGIPGKHSIFFLVNFTLTAKLDITKSRL